jgi:plastocyanin
MLQKIKIITGLIIGITLILACENDSGDSNGDEPASNEVWMQNNDFVPLEKTISAGTTVKWINKDNVPHTVTSANGLFSSGNISGGGIFEYTFDSAGTYEYTCTLHADMDGTIIVE